jgi:LacI family transcriptional regulator
MKPTIYTIAKEAGVSIATVSRALNNGSRISEATRNRVLDVANQMGYQPSASARNLAMKTTESLALVLPQISGPYYSELIRGAESISHINNYHLLIYSSPDVDNDDALLRLLPTRTDGIILGTHSSTLAYIRQLVKRHFPFILLGYSIPNLSINSIYPDNETGAYQLTLHLIKVHHFRKIGFICGPENQNHSRERLVGYQQALIESDIKIHPEWIVPGKFDEGSGFLGAQQLFNLPDQLQAIVAANDQMAIGALAAARTANYSVPEDIAIVGFDDVPSAQYMQPPLTTVSLAIFEQGAKAVAQLLKQITQPDLPAQAIIVSTSVIVRSSCGCQPSG